MCIRDRNVPAPKGDIGAPLKALIFDSYYDNYKGVVIYTRVFDGIVKKGDIIRLMNTGKNYEVTEVGVYAPSPTPIKELRAGEVGYICGSIKQVRDANVGDTITLAQRPTSEPLPGYKASSPMVYCGIYPGEGEKYDNVKMCIRDRYIKLPKLGYVRIRQSMEIGKINHVTVERTPTGKYFVVLNVEFEPQPMSNKGGSIGIDVGIKEFYSDSNGNVVSNPKYLEKTMRKLVREQRRLSRKEKGSNNRNKQRVKAALVHEKVTSQRNDFLQKQSTMLIRENQTICIEDLKVKNMLRNHKLARHISSCLLYTSCMFSASIR